MQQWVLVAAALCLAVASPATAAPTGTVKVIAPPQTLETAAGSVLLSDYGAFGLYRVPETSLRALPPAARSAVSVLDERILFDARTFEPLRDRFSVPSAFAAEPARGGALQLVQFVGPIKDQWLDEVRATGARPIHYVANQGYLVWADDAGRAALANLAAAGDVLQWSATLPPYLKLSPTIRARFETKDRTFNPDEVIPVTIQMVRHQGQQTTEAAIAELTRRRLSAWTAILEYQNVVAEVRAGDIQALSRLGAISWIGERLPRELNDEVQNQVMAGAITGGGPTSPGYLAFLTGLGFSTAQADYPIVDITDDGIGTGAVNSGDPTFHEGGSTSNPTRLAYVANCTAAANGAGPDGHGHINTSIVGGYDTRSGFPFRDPDGYQRGMGVNPFGRIAGTRVFGPGFDESACGGTDTGMIRSIWLNGARINTNSWGCSGCAGTYDDSSQAYDVGIRDADLTAGGNQQLTIVFSAGNSGPGAGTIGSPGNGKNMITVGASENDRPSDESGSWTDGCGIGPTGANNVMDVISFSSRGPAPGNRKKPEVIAPGTHIQGTASTNASYNGSGVCDQFRPGAQTVFAASSGTSHSTPAVAGLASLVHWWLDNDQATGLGTDPSPAMTKAYLLAHPTYLTGTAANDTLPSNVQGYGMPNMGLLFDDTQKYLLDQSEVFDATGETWTWSGAVADNTKPVRIALVYTDQAGAIGTSPQVNNLNLDATVAGTSYHGNVFSSQWSVSGGLSDSLNNYEAIFVQPGASGAIEITVTAANIAGDGVPGSGDATDQDFAIVCFNCVEEPTFTLQVAPTALEICAPTDAVYNLTIGSVLGFTDPVTLSVSGNPAGTTTLFSTNPVTPPGTSTLTIGSTGSGTPGTYTLQIDGVSGAITQSRNVGLELYTATPGTPTLTAPANGAVNVAASPNFTWSAATQADTYTLEVATDTGFTSIVATVSGIAGTSATLASPLNTNTVYYWRVRATNACGTSSNSATFSFTTIPAPGDCQIGLTPTVHFFTSFESGATGWTHNGTGDTWATSTARAHAGTVSYHASSPDEVSDQRAHTPAITLPPAAGQPISLVFWQHQTIEDQPPSGCFDAAVIDISTDGVNYTRLQTEILVDPYDGPVSTTFSSPLAGQTVWCGDPQDWTKVIADLSAFAGQTVNLRFRHATDNSVDHEGWYIDEVAVQSCLDSVFSDGFETGNTSAWTLTVP